SDEYWASVRQVPLTKTESTMDVFMNRIEQIPGFKYVIFGAKALIENHVETGNKEHPSKFDIGPINTMISSNYVDGTRFRLSGMTTAKLNPHWFFSGYGAYGLKDKKWKYEANATYSFRKCDYFPWEFPKHFITASYRYDVMSPMDKFLATDKDNVFVAWKTTTVDQMSYVRDASLSYEMELPSGFSVAASARHREDTPTGNLQYIRNSPNKYAIPGAE
ncbi:MAG: carboxypeptidase-like regulatory domain-containing protein, partial [Bacteroides sp.]